MHSTTLREVTDQCPFPRYDELRRSGPVVWDDDRGGWVVLDYASSAFVMSHRRLFELAEPDLPGGRGMVGSVRGIETTVGDEHLKLHKFLMKLIDEDYVAIKRRTLIRPIADMLIDRFAGRDRVDLASEYAQQIPVRVGMGILGISLDDEQSNDEFADRLRTLRSFKDRWQESWGTDPVHNETAANAALELKDIFMPYVRDRKERPADDLITKLWQGGPAIFSDWDENDVYAGCLAYFAGGSTQRMLRNLLYLVLSRPEIQERVRERSDEVTSRFIVEGLRTLGVYQWTLRRATADTTLAGVNIRRGDRVYPGLVAANYDPAAFECPHEMRLDTDRPRHHLSFGFGEKYCIGAPLVIGQALETVNALIDRFSVLTLDDEAEQPSYRGLRVRSYSPLHARIGSHPAASTKASHSVREIDGDELYDLRHSIAESVMARMKKEIPGLSPHFGEDYEKSDDSEAGTSGRAFHFLAFAFKPWRMWDLHVGVVPVGGRRLSLGFHVSERAAPVMMAALERLGAGIGARVQHQKVVVEYQANFPPVAVDDASAESIVDTIIELCRKYAPEAAAVACPAHMRDDAPEDVVVKT